MNTLTFIKKVDHTVIEFIKAKTEYKIWISIS